MKKIVLAVLSAAALAALLVACEAGDLGFYLYTPAPAAGTVEAPAPELEVVGYLPANKVRRVALEQVQSLTDLVYFTLTPRADGTLNHAILTDSHRAFLLQAKTDFGIRILMGVADHSRSGALATIASQPALRDKFVTGLTDFLLSEGFDGADFDWEYPGSGMLDAYAQLLAKIHESFVPHGLKVTVAVSPSKPLTALAYASVDRVHGMLYDDAGQHSTLEKAADHVEKMIAQGVDPSKLLLGVPFYGRGYTSTGPKWSSAVSYRTLNARYNISPDQDTAHGYYFNGPETVRRKVQYAKQAGLSGVMIWEIGQDVKGDNSLLGAISDARKDLGLN